MNAKHTSVCASGCKGGYEERQHDYTFTRDELASLPERGPDGRSLSILVVRWCSYCGCVYLGHESPIILGYKDLEPIGSVSWVPTRSALD